MDKLKSGYVGVVGLPNVGKSTFVNYVINAKVSITSNKPQTTRKNVMGVLTNENSQMIFIDSPGFIQSSEGLNSFLETEWRRVLDDVDVLVFLIGLDSKKESFEKTLEMIDTTKKDKIVLITKTDLNLPEREFLIEEELRKRNLKYFKSRRKGKTDRLEISGDILAELNSYMPETNFFYYGKDMYTPQTMRDLSSEVILESIFRFLSDEIPYETCVQIRDFKENQSLFKIYADVVVSKDRYKKIIIGKGGETIKKIGMMSRKSLEMEFGQKIFLDLKVKCKEGWNKKSVFLKEMGYEQRK